MLLRNKSKVNHSIHIDLVFDDNKRKQLDIHEFDYIRVIYKHNDCKKHAIGRVKEIRPYLRSKCCSNQCEESAIIIMDCSEYFEAEVIKFDIKDIIDIMKLTPEYCCCNWDQDSKHVEPPVEEEEVEDGQEEA